MSELLPEDDPEPHPVGIELIKDLSYLNFGLNDAQRSRRLKAIESNAGRIVLVAVSGVYFNIARFDRTSIDWSCIETDSQHFVGELEAESGPFEVEYNVAGTRFVASTAGIIVADSDWRLFVPSDSLSGAYLGIEEPPIASGATS